MLPMALVQCAECQKPVATTAAACPNCGAPIKRKSSFSPLRVVLIVIGVVGLFLSLSGGSIVAAPVGCSYFSLRLPNDSEARLRGSTAQRQRGVDLISDVLPFRRLWDGEPNAIRYAEFYGRSHGIVIRVYDEAANLIERRTHAGDFKEPRSIPITALPPWEGVWLRFPCEILQPNLSLAIADRLSSPTQPITMSAGRRVISIFIVSVSRTYLFSYV
jgi:hypothetical protein